MSRLPIELKARAIAYRKRGYSIKELTSLFKIAQSTASLWSRDVKLSQSAKKRLLSRIERGQYISAERKKEKTTATKEKILKEAKELMSVVKLSNTLGQLICALIYWCEGAKNDSYVNFTNSDPNLVRLFIDLLVKHYAVDKSKFRARLHLHSYHIPKREKKFWQKKLGLVSDAFYRPYLKPNSGKRMRNNYAGCVSLSYYDTMLARKLLAIAKVFMMSLGA